MKNRLLILLIGFALTTFLSGAVQNMHAQTEQMARNYADQGEYEKAILSYRKALQKQQGSRKLISGLAKTYQELEQYDQAEEMLQSKRVLTRDDGFLLVELGYNEQLRGRDSLAKVYFEQVFDGIREGKMSPYSAGRTFEEKSLLKEAVIAYEATLGNNSSSNSAIQINLAKLYGELGEIEKMFGSYLDLINSRGSSVRIAQRNLGQYITEDPLNESNIIFRKILLKRIQSEQNILHNELLSWLFVQQKQYMKAFIQEKAIYRRTDGSYEGLENLADVAIAAGAMSDAAEILTFLKENVTSEDVTLQSEQKLIKIDIMRAQSLEERLEIEQRYEAILAQYGTSDLTVPIQIDYAHFLAFYLENPAKAIEYLKTVIKKPRGRFDEARLKMELADILVLSEKFNQALIYYSQIQNKIKNNIISQEARFKVAKTSYYKGDFDWAESQLEVLKGGATQLIANDALELLLVIRDNSQDDSLQTALKKYARADLLGYQNKREEAIKLYDDILEVHKGEKIEDEALLAQAKLLEQKGNYTKAERNYSTIIEYYREDILADDAYYRLGRLYEDHLNQPDKAKDNYERIIFDLADSIYYVEAQKRFRSLRGDAIN